MRSTRAWGAAAAALIAATSVTFPGAVMAAGSNGTVSVQVVPALAGVQLAVGPAVVTTDGGGYAVADVTDLNNIADTVSLVSDQLGARTRIAISKVKPLPHVTASQSNLKVGLDVTSLVHLRVKPGTTDTPASSVRLLRLHSITGKVFDVNPVTDPVVRLLSRRTRLTNNVLTAQHVTWSVDRVAAGPGNAVTTAGPRFDPFGQVDWNLQLRPVRGTVEISTVPALAHVTFALEGTTGTTGPDGTAHVAVTDLNDIPARLRLGTSAAGSRSVSLLQVTRLNPGAPHHRRVLAALEVRRNIDLRFVDPLGASVPASRVQRVDLSGGGPTISLTGAQIRAPVSLPEAIATHAEGQWIVRPITWSVSAVRFDGSDAVFAGRQHYRPSASKTWNVTLSVFRVRMRVRDVLFGSGVGTHVWITGAGGSGFGVRVGSGTPAVVPGLVRGLYDLRVDAAVFGKHTKVLVSRDDLVEVRVVTPLDIAMIVLAVLVVGVGVILLGRRASAKQRIVAPSRSRQQ